MLVEVRVQGSAARQITYHVHLLIDGIITLNHEQESNATQLPCLDLPPYMQHIWPSCSPAGYWCEWR